MDAVTLIKQAEDFGLALSVDGDHLKITGPNTLAAAALVQRMTPFKADIISALAPMDTEPPTLNPTNLVGQVVDAQRFYDLQQATKAIGWILHGARFCETVDGYCNEWLITRAIAP